MMFNMPKANVDNKQSKLAHTLDPLEQKSHQLNIISQFSLSLIQINNIDFTIMFHLLNFYIGFQGGFLFMHRYFYMLNDSYHQI